MKVDIRIAIIQLIVSVYDLITLPVYFLLQRPWRKWGYFQYANHVVRGDVTSPLFSTAAPSTHWLTKYTTYTEICRQAMRKYAHCNGFGVRQVLDAHDVVQPDGKVVTKKLLDDKYTWITYGDADQRMDAIAKVRLRN